LANSPYTLAEPLTVNSGITLTIEPGVTVIMNLNVYLQVYGTIVARGNSAEKIFVHGGEIRLTPNSTGWNEQTASGSVIENAIFDSATITVSNSAKINNNTIDGAINVNGGSPYILNNTIYGSHAAINICGGSPQIKYNQLVGGINSNSSVRFPIISNNYVVGPVVVEGGSPVISGNLITSINYQSIGIGLTGYNFGDDKLYNAVVTDNIVVGFLTGICWNAGEGAIIARNLIENCSGAGLSIGSNAKVENNTIRNSSIGIRIYNFNVGIPPSDSSVPPTISNNNIENNFQYNIYSYCGRDLNAAYNWWGTTDSQAIGQTIYDHKSESNLGYITFVPFLTEPNPQAMPDPNMLTQLPTPIPMPTPTPAPTPSPTNQTITRIQSYQYGAGMGAANEPTVQTSIKLANAPIQGNVLISVIGIQGIYTTVTDAQGVVTAPSSFETATISSINETGVMWTRQVRSNSTAFNLNVEIWLGVVVSQASPSITVNLDKLPSNTITALTIDICEYKGIAANSSLDKTATNTGFGSAADTGLTAPTTQPNELWIGAILFESSGQQRSPTNGFLLFDGQPNATGGRICTALLENIVDGVGTANSGTTIKYGDEFLFCAWVGCISTFSSTPVTTPSSTPSPSNGTSWDIFSVESNSTVTALAFNSTSSELIFAVTGPSGTAGYVKATIAKSLVPNAENIKVYLDGKQLDYELTSNADSWLLTFTYQHSTHQVRINLANAAEATRLGIEYWMWIGVAIILVVAGVLGFIIWRTKKTMLYSKQQGFTR
jgi:hypothetical protein